MKHGKCTWKLGYDLRTNSIPINPLSSLMRNELFSLVYLNSCSLLASGVENGLSFYGCLAALFLPDQTYHDVSKIEILVNFGPSDVHPTIP